MKRLLQFLIGAAVFFTWSVSWAQAVDPELGAGWDIAGTIYLILGGLFSTGLAWGGKKLIDLINAKIANEILRGILGRLVGSVRDAVAMVDQTLRQELKQAKDPASPGGEKITEAEAEQMKQEVWDTLKSEYGGWDGLFGLLKKIGIGDESAAKDKIDTMIEAAVHEKKLRSGPQ